MWLNRPKTVLQFHLMGIPIKTITESDDPPDVASSNVPPRLNLWSFDPTAPRQNPQSGIHTGTQSSPGHARPRWRTSRRSQRHTEVQRGGDHRDRAALRPCPCRRTRPTQCATATIPSRHPVRDNPVSDNPAVTPVPDNPLGTSQLVTNPVRISPVATVPSARIDRHPSR